MSAQLSNDSFAFVGVVLSEFDELGPDVSLPLHVVVLHCGIGIAETNFGDPVGSQFLQIYVGVDSDFVEVLILSIP